MLGSRSATASRPGTVLLQQLRAALNIIQDHNPARITTLGGECSVSMAPFSYLINKHREDMAILWIDSHPDMGTGETAYPGYHAMIVSALTGHGDPELLTSVFDWGCSMYSDHLYDFAWLTFCAPYTSGFDRLETRRLARQHYVNEGFDPDDFDRRMDCYELHIGLGALTYRAFLGDEGAAQSLAQSLTSSIQKGRTVRLRD